MATLPRLLRTLLTAACACAAARGSSDPLTERLYLSGHGPKDAVPWDFTVTGGRRAGEHTTIPVPSNWELQGFGTYNYGQEPTPKADEHGLYSLKFAVPEAWKGRRIELVFEGVMTDATVRVNGKSAGPMHIGAFYRFRYDVTSTVKLGSATENLLEVDVSKVSSNPDSEKAERYADYWVFGGIFRPVWLEASPMQAMEHTAIDARADGSFSAEVAIPFARDATSVEAQIVGADGRPAAPAFSTRVPAGGAGRVWLSTKIDHPLLWSAETPNLYTVLLTLRKGEEVLHATRQRFGFRTFEVRPGQGLYLNGQRILLKGVDRHSFRPETARALNAEDCVEDVRLIREMNMNAARMSHYPPDEAFLEACDEIGLYVLDELSGWQHAHDTLVGHRLVREMVERDVNHPSILFWDNGNEGGFNRALDGDFALYDPQHRHVLHPWEIHDDVDTKHYPNWDDITRRLGGPNIVMPTEFIHSIYDGGAGAGLDDYWKAISISPFGGGGFIWMMADEGVVRTDQGGRIDVFSTYDPDGIVGPHHEKEGSFFTIREIYSPVQVASPVLEGAFNGELSVSNHYDFTSLARCRFSWQLLHYPDPSAAGEKAVILSEGSAQAPDIAPHAAGQMRLPLPADWNSADALALTAFGPDDRALWTWTWPIPALTRRMAALVTGTASGKAQVQSVDGQVRLSAAGVAAVFDAHTGLLIGITRGDRTAALTDGPRLTFGRPESAGNVEWLSLSADPADSQSFRLAGPQTANAIELDLDYTKTLAYAAFKLEISADGHAWRTLIDASRRSNDGKRYNFPPQQVLAVRLSHVRRPDGTPLAVKAVRLGYAASRFPSDTSAAAVVTSGTSAEGASTLAWIDVANPQGLGFRWTMKGDGSLRLDYHYRLEGPFIYHGITFDHAENRMISLRWLGQGPYRVWQNRLRGTQLGVNETARNEIQPGESWQYPEFQGYFAGLRWARLSSNTGPLTITSASPDVFLRVGTPRLSHINTSPDFPAGDLSFLHAIAAIGSKFITPEKSGPASQPSAASGEYRGSLLFQFGGG